MKRVAERYLIASIAFGVATVWLGVSFVTGFECLLAFLVTSLVVGVIQRRQVVAARRRGRRASTRRPERRSHAAHDDAAEPADWPLLADHGW